MALLIIGHTLWSQLLPYLHIFILSVTAVLCILSDYNQFYGIGQVIMLIVLLYKYGMLYKNIRKKLITLSFCFIATVEISIFNSELSGIGVEVFLYLAYFLFFLYIIYKNEIDAFIALRSEER
ncbi:MAG: hypothetical protein PQJ60_01860, partial [Spirochaetales bacterium]|nr:hypothetical protein [Spirochaetales bacterium]